MTGPHRLPTDGCPLLLGDHQARLGRRGRPRCLHHPNYARHSWLGRRQGLENCPALHQDAQEPSVHPLLRSKGSQQVGLLVRSVQSHHVLLHHLHPWIHLDQGHVRCFWTGKRHCAGCWLCHCRCRSAHCCVGHEAVHGQEDQCFQHLDRCSQLLQCALVALLHPGLWRSSKSDP